MKIHILPDLEVLSLEAAGIFFTLSKRYIEGKGSFLVAVSGGTTPARLFAILGAEYYRDLVDWRRIHFFWADERFVPHDHEESNYRVLREYLLSRIPIPPENVHPIRTDVSSAEVSAKFYEEEIKKFFEFPRKVPEFDLVFLGLGEDGHIASLFPGSEVLGEKNRLVASVNDRKHRYPRVTLTLAVINNANNIVFLISGSQKAVIVKKVIEDKDSTLPASLVKRNEKNITFLIDEDAGSLLTKKDKKFLKKVPDKE